MGANVYALTFIIVLKIIVSSSFSITSYSNHVIVIMLWNDQHVTTLISAQSNFYRDFLSFILLVLVDFMQRSYPRWAVPLQGRMIIKGALRWS